MKLTDEQKVVVVLLFTGSIILVVTQIMIDEYGQVGTFITRARLVVLSGDSTV